MRTSVIKAVKGEVAVSRSCAYFGISRSGYYASCQMQERVVLEEGIVLDLILEIRRQMPRIGGKKLYHMVGDKLSQIGKIGRDKFFDNSSSQ